MPSDCHPEICAALNERQHAFHLLILEGKSQRAAHREAGYEAKDRDAAASTLASNCKVRAAIQHHRDLEAERYSKTKDRQIERLVAQAEGSDPRHFASMGPDGVTFKDWDEVPGGLTRGVASLSETTAKDGSVTLKMTFRDPVAAERLLADLGGWKAPKVITITPDLVARYQAGDEEARRELQKIAAGEE